MDKSTPIYAVNRQDADYLEFSGMKDVRVLTDRITYGSAEIIKVTAVHGTIKPCCEACGYVFRSPNEKTLYVAGDTVWCDEVAKTVEKYHPDVRIRFSFLNLQSNDGLLSCPSPLAEWWRKFVIE